MRDTNNKNIPTCSAGVDRNCFSSCLYGCGVEPTSLVLFDFIDMKENFCAITALIA